MAIKLKITATLGDILYAPWSNSWEDFCDKYDGYSIYCINEGLANSKDEVELEIEDAVKYGLIKNNLR